MYQVASVSLHIAAVIASVLIIFKKYIMLLTRDLTIKEQEQILKRLFGFTFKNDVMINEEGKEFYEIVENCQFDLSTLAGIFSYATYIANKQGYAEAQFNMRQSIGLSSNCIKPAVIKSVCPKCGEADFEQKLSDIIDYDFEK